MEEVNEGADVPTVLSIVEKVVEEGRGEVEEEERVVVEAAEVEVVAKRE